MALIQMRLKHIDEPELQFGTSKHVDIRFGLKHFGPLDFAEDSAPKQINVGIVGTPETNDAVSYWLDSSRNGVVAKESSQPTLFTDFPGYGPPSRLTTPLVFDPKQEQVLTKKDLAPILSLPRKAAVEAAVDLFAERIEYLAQHSTSTVIICAPPAELLSAMNDYELDEDVPAGGSGKPADFHHLLKATAMRSARPIQILRPSTYDETKRKKKRKGGARTLQDAATRAWNLYVALYYKAGGVPWRLERRSREYMSCFIGIAFYEDISRTKLLTSVAQVFNDRGEGMIVRGASATIDKEDRQPHLSEGDAYSLLDTSLKSYRTEHHHLPARVVVHKTSTFSEGETEGLKEAASANGVESLDLINLGDSSIRLFRTAEYPVLRGTYLEVDSKKMVLYTRGSVEFFRTYPGSYVPQSLGVQLHNVEQSPDFVAQELLSLTKMSWNNTQFDGYEPITIKAAHQVGQILKYVPEGAVVRQSYSYYM